MERNNNNIHIKENEVYYRIQSSDLLYKAVKHFGTKFVSESSGCKLGITTINTCRRSKERKLKQFILDVLDYGKTVLNYNNTTIIVNLVQFDKPLSNEGGSLFHSEMEIQVLNNDNTRDENKENLQTFFEESIKYYNEGVRDLKKEVNKTTIYIWDEYWETLEKGKSRSLSTIYLDGKEDQIKNTLKDFLSEETEEKYNKFGVPYKYNMLFHGYPGTGKTSLIYSLANELDLSVALLSFNQKMQDADLMRAMRRLPDDTILVIEDVDSLFHSRKKNDELKNNISFSGLLNTLDGIGHLDKQIIIMTTNHPLVLDNALKRPGRVDYSLEFNYANKNQIKKMFNTFLPEQSDKFTEFYKNVKHLKLTTAILQQFLFSNMNVDNIIESLDELQKLCNDNNYDSKKDLYS